MITQISGKWYFTCTRCKPPHTFPPYDTKKLAEFAEAVHKQKRH